MKSAISRAQEMILTLTTQHGPEHPDVFAAHLALFTASSDAGLRHTLVSSTDELFNRAQRVLGLEHPLTLTLAHEHAEALGAVSRDVESLNLHQRVHNLRVRVLGPDHKDTLESLDSIGARHRALSDGPAALSTYEQLYAARLRLSGPTSRETLLARNGVGMALATLNRQHEAVGLYEELLPTAEGTFDADSSLLLSIRNNYANALGAVRRHAESAAVHGHVYGERLRTGEPNQVMILRSTMNLCGQLRELGDYTEALNILEGAIDSASGNLGAKHPQMTQAKLELVALLWFSGLKEEAFALHTKISEDCIEAYGFAHPTTLFCHESMAERLVERGEIPAATAVRRTIHAAAMEAFSECHLMKFWAHHILASGLSWAKEHAEGLEFALLAASGRRRLLGPDHQGTVESEIVVAHTLAWLKRHHEASDQYGYVADLLSRQRGESDRDVIKNRWSAARQLFKAGEQENALPLLTTALQNQIAAHGEHDDVSLKMLSLFARNLYEAGDWESALEHTSRWANLVETCFGSSAQQTVDALTVLAEWCEGLEVPDQALDSRRRLLRSWRLTTGPDSEQTLEGEECLIAAYVMFGDLGTAAREAAGFYDDRCQRLGGTDEKTLKSHATLARLLELQGEWEALISLRRKALKEVMSEAADIRIVQDLEFALADALAAAGKDEEAQERLGHLLDTQRATLGAAHPRTVRVQQAVARLYLRSDKPSDAVPHYEHLIKAQRNSDGKDTPESLESRLEFAHLQHELGLSEAHETFRSNYELAVRLLPDDARLLAARNDFARSLYEEGQHEQAFELLRWNVVESTRILGEEHSDTTRIRYSLANALADAGHAHESVEILQAAVDDHARTGGGLVSVLPMLRTLADTLRESGRSTDVPEAYRRVISILSDQFPLPQEVTETELRERLPDPFRYEDAIELELLNVAELQNKYGHHHPEARAATDKLLMTLQAVLSTLNQSRWD
ncbi:tetratricopeptide repeat protein [Arthrobacter sp. W4I7]|uniref:tetratricopeptide repeat protein n=1 Tax=Arthrobacter sp. W4I7 TaxID=3042296 RepID=UPI00277EC4CE|nr:tetratricopeptide repeat protein [Arthrobacter sp. W4I7]MDQ0691752.1 tetratricopeptide (TPR) repeat protein [Arthrobacter sp. W4I7]